MSRVELVERLRSAYCDHENGGTCRELRDVDAWCHGCLALGAADLLVSMEPDIDLLIDAIRAAMFFGGVPEAVAIEGLKWFKGDADSVSSRATLERWARMHSDPESA